MKVLYKLFNKKFDFPEDIQVFYEHENATLMMEFLNRPWKDEDEVEHRPETDGVYEIGAETFTDEEWPTVLRVLTIMRHTPKDEAENIEIVKNVMAAKEEVGKKGTLVQLEKEEYQGPWADPKIGTCGPPETTK